jgi:hypothetical protein
MNDYIKVLMPANEIPVGAKVTLPEKSIFSYILVNEIEIIADGITHHNYAHPDSLFLIQKNSVGSLKVIKPTTELIWYITEKEHKQYLKNLLSEN